MSHDEIPRQPTISFRLTVEKNTSSPMTSPRRQQRQPTPELETATSYMSGSPRITPIDWKHRCETIQFEHQLELERIRLHYEHELKEKVAGREKHEVHLCSKKHGLFSLSLTRNQKPIETRIRLSIR
jgi:hypothetical protein